jgi:hypothetical protein
MTFADNELWVQADHDLNSALTPIGTTIYEGL